MTAGEKMRMLRKKRRLTKVAVAKDLGLSYSAYSKYERDERNPKDPTKKKIAKYYRVSVNYIFFN